MAQVKSQGKRKGPPPHNDENDDDDDDSFFFKHKHFVQQADES